MQTSAAIIAEYNPFHKGHAYQIQKTKEKTGAEYIVVLMSGDYVQRGTPALFAKHQRAKMALLGGADIVLELPSYYACASAEFFAKGAVKTLDALGCIRYLSFGSEAGDLDSCLALSRILWKEPAYYQEKLKKGLKSGQTFPTARKGALSEYLSRQKDSSVFFDPAFLDTPNNILGIEYCKALFSQNSSIIPVTIKREGNAYHETSISRQLPSASAIRSLLSHQDCSDSQLFPLLSHTQPKAVYAYMQELLAGTPPVWENDYSLLLKYQLMQHNPDTLCQYADVSPELSRRIYNRLKEFSSFSQFAQILKTKELTYTRINRALLHILLGVSHALPGMNPAYVRLLGFKKESSAFLRTIQKSTSIPLLTKAADYQKKLSPTGKTAFEKDIFVSDLYESVKCEKKQAAFSSDLQKSPVILP